MPRSGCGYAVGPDSDGNPEEELPRNRVRQPGREAGEGEAAPGTAAASPGLASCAKKYPIHRTTTVIICKLIFTFLTILDFVKSTIFSFFYIE